MHRPSEKSSSESNLQDASLASNMVTPPGTFVNTRSKRKRPDELLTEFSDFKDEIKAMFSSWMSQNNNERVQISSSLKSIETSLSFLSTQFDDMKKKMQDLERDRQKDKDYILVLENKIEDLQKLQRKSSFQLKNVPKNDNESKSSLVNMVSQLCSTLKVDIQTSDIADIYRTSTKGDKKPIVVELTSFLQKNNILSAAKKYNSFNKSNKLNSLHLGLKCSNTPIYISDHLTPRGYRLFYLARELTRTDNYKFCWTSLGDVLVRKDENSPIIKIISECQIQNLRVNK